MCGRLGWRQRRSHFTSQEMSARVGACLMTTREVFEQAGGIDELSHAFWDVRLLHARSCARSSCFCTPLAELTWGEPRAPMAAHRRAGCASVAKQWGGVDEVEGRISMSSVWPTR